MKKSFYRFRSLILCIAFLALSSNTFASHIVGMDLNYTWISSNKYKITVVAYGNCGTTTGAFETLPSATPQVCVFRGNTYVATLNLTLDSALSFINVTPVCPRDTNRTQCTNTSFTIPGIKKFTYSATYLVPSLSKYWRFIFSGSMGSASGAGRAVTITNIDPGAGGTLTGLEDTLNNTIGNQHNTSPNLTVLPVPFFCDSASDNYNPGAVDVDRDSLVFHLVPGWIGYGSCGSGTMGTVTYTVTGVSGTEPMKIPTAASSFTFDPATGQISFYPVRLQRALVVYNIEEFRRGPTGDTLCGTSQREMTFTVLSCTNTSPTAVLDSAIGLGGIDSTGDSSHYHICANSGPFSISLDPHEEDTSLKIFVTAAGLPTGSTLTVTGDTTNHPHVVFSWTSDSIAFGTYTFFLTFTDDHCPLVGQQTIAYTISIYPTPVLNYVVTVPATCTDPATVEFIPGGLGQPWRVLHIPDSTIISPIPDITSFSRSYPPGRDTFVIYSAFSSLCSGHLYIKVDSAIINDSVTFTNPTYCGNNDGTITINKLTSGNQDSLNYAFGGRGFSDIREIVSRAGTITLNRLCAGDYSNIFITHGYCISNPVDIVLTQVPFPTIRMVIHNPTSCGARDGYITLYGLNPSQTDTVTYINPAGITIRGTDYVGTDSILIISSLRAGTYSNIQITTGGACGAVPSCTSNILGPVTLTAPPIVPSFTDYIHYGCTADTVIFVNHSTDTGSSSANTHYTWYFGDGTTDTSTNPVHVYMNSGTSTSTYSVTLNLNNTTCDSNFSSIVTLSNFINASFTSSPASYVCQDTVIIFNNTSVGTAPTYTWYFGDGTSSTLTSPIHTYTNTGTYLVTLIATNFVPCSDTATEILAVDSTSVISLHVSDTTLCQGQAITLSSIYATQGLNLLTWNFGDGTIQTNVNPAFHVYDTTGLLTVTLSFAYRACIVPSLIKNIFIARSPAINLGPDTSICPGSKSIVLADYVNAGNTAASWLWSTGAVTAGITVNAPGSYFSIVSIGGCSASDTVFVANDCYLDIPNVFTPNGDGTNDYFFPRASLTKGLTVFSLNIYNRWGQVVFQTTGVDGRGWDGKFNNVPQPDGVYIYYIDATFKDGQKEHRQGNITLLR